MWGFDYFLPIQQVGRFKVNNCYLKAQRLNFVFKIPFVINYKLPPVGPW